MAQYRGNEEGNVLRWFIVLKNIVGNVTVVKPSNAQTLSKRSVFFNLLAMFQYFLSYTSRSMPTLSFLTAILGA